MPARHLLIAGRVQGVGFRAFVAAAARRHGATGWVRNLTDGRVEAVVSGNDTVVAAMITACREGPPSSRVDTLDEAVVDPPHNTGFSMLPTV